MPDSSASGRPAGDEARTILQGGRRKAYRPLPAEERRAALEAGLAAFDRGDFFLAHELLEPAWMGTADVAERELLQGLIKLAAAYVHAVRGNPAGVAKNLRGALTRLESGTSAGPGMKIDAEALIADVRERLAAQDDDHPRPPTITRVTNRPVTERP